MNYALLPLIKTGIRRKGEKGIGLRGENR